MKWNDPYQALVPICFAIQLVTNVTCNYPPYLKASPEAKTEHIHLQPPGLLIKFSRDRDNLRLAPRKKHLKTAKLLRRLKDNFDADYMSITTPSRIEVLASVKTSPVLQQQVLALNLSQLLGQVGTVDDTVTVVKLVQSWLVEKASCPVYHRWEDLGLFFWPRWVKFGYCSNDEVPCSWPPGMNCVPAESKRIKILRWHCRYWKRPRGHRNYIDYRVKKDTESNDTEDWKSRLRKENLKKKLRKRCKWIKVPYPVTDECYCSC